MIRLRQQGAKNRQTYRLVVTDQRNPRDGKYIEMLGWYNPFEEGEKNSQVKDERLKYWLEKGAMLTPKAQALVKRNAPEVLKNHAQEKKKK